MAWPWQRRKAWEAVGDVLVEEAAEERAAAQSEAEARSRAAAEARARGYYGAGPGRRSEGWTVTAGDANTHIGQSLADLRKRSRALVRDNAHAAKAIDVFTGHLVGEGIRPLPVTGSDDLDTQVMGLWNEWGAECQTDGSLDVYGVQVIAVRGWLESGDVLVRQRPRRLTDGLPIPLQLQVLEGDFLDDQRNGRLTGDRKVIQGVELDSLDRRSAYWLYREHPHATVGALFGMPGTDSVRVPADRVAHLYGFGRPGQVRNVPWLTPAIAPLRGYGDTSDAVLVRRRTEACIVGHLPDRGPYDIDPGINPSGVRDAKGRLVENIAPGLILYDADGMEFFQPTSSGGHEAWATLQLHEIAAAARMPYELLTGDLSRVNYSSIRFGMLDFQRRCRQLQKLAIVPQLLRPQWKWFIDTSIAADRLPARDRRGRDIAYNVAWVMPAWMQIDPEKEAKARRLKLQNGEITLRQIAAEDGWTLEELLADHVKVANKLDALGLVFETDPRGRRPGKAEAPSDAAAEDDAQDGSDSAAA